MSQKDLPGAATYLLASLNVSSQDVAEEQEEEIETMAMSSDFDDRLAVNSHYVRPPSETDKKPKIDQSELAKNLKKASEHVVVEDTLNEYRRLWKQFTEFCAHIGYVKTSEAVEKLWPNLPADFPMWIAIWVMHKADEVDIFTGHLKDPSIPRVTYATAQKMRAAISHKFGRDFGLGTQPWAENPLTPGKFAGNPSLSVIVSQYMVSLHRRKVDYLVVN
ncbi:hypothetical protein A0H81_08475 [Grifola frondosa]|uniref:Uncharacterized protein n=1 Tax=Grifola frondosa TaxID=5627 RepID=A0A1C7M3Q3_GRIFR|nr:hypothetical protein A0H81_08475 [Grifola frondosa]